MKTLLTSYSALVSVPLIALTLAISTHAQDPVSTNPGDVTPEAHVRQQLQSAHTLFIEDDGEDSEFPARDTNAYMRFVTSMQNWGRYRIVTDVKSADMVLQFRAAASTTVVNGTTDDPTASIYHRPYLKLVLATPDTLAPVWTVTVPVFSGKSHGKDLFDLSISNATSQVKLLAGDALTTQEKAGIDYIATQHRHHLVLALGLTAVFVGAAIGTGIIMKNKFDAAAARDKQAQLDFCQQNHIPNCAV